MSSKLFNIVLIGLAFLGMSACDQTSSKSEAPTQSPPPVVEQAPQAARVNAERLIAADSEPGNWMTHGRTYDEQRYSPLNQVTTDNVGELGLAWSFDLNTGRGIEATSIVVDGVMYMTSSWSIVHALDARTGQALWSYDPEVPKDKLKHGCCGPINRGVAVWEGQVFVGAFDGRLIALDAATGKVNWSVATFDPALPYTITGAPRVVKGKVLIGNGGAEYGVRGYISAYSVTDGAMAWRFYTIPGNPADGFENDTMAMAAETWNGEWWKMGGGGTVWDSMAYDPELDLLYIGVGNGTPWNQNLRSPGGGDNLFLSSIVALRPDTGEYVWHYQTTPGETWDYTATQHIILADLEISGELRKVLVQAPKNGFFYLIDRTDGSLLSAENYINITWATHVNIETGRPVEVPGARYYETGPFLVFPSYLGGHNWHPMSFSPDTGLVYIPVLDIPAVYGADKNFEYNPGVSNLGIDATIASLPDDQAERDGLRPMISGRLVAWDPLAQKEVWRVQHSGAWNGGALSTAGNLVFQGSAAGKLVAYTADNGVEQWSFPTQTGVVAAPISYEIDGEQYISVNVGWGGAFALVFGEFVQAESLPNVSRVLTFKLGATGSLPEVDWNPVVTFNPPQQTASDEVIQKGFGLYQNICMACHGMNAVSGLLITDLRGSGFLHDAASWDSVVRDGVLREKGMASFEQQVSEEESQAIRAYVIQQAWRGFNLQKSDGEGSSD
jgi:PQQ-dependent dehydrogenase (methanol/ethanol family)